MEAVKIFNAELAGLYECKPPISKAKMTAITKAAIRAIKFYKHVVQSVEKFIQKCKTEYKIPGLYVIDSIVRQSRHQFSIEKDVFAPRFAKNITVTFFYLFKCPQEDKSKVIRVLNLWQKNHVFAEDVIQPLFDLADPNHSIHKEVGNLIALKANKTKVVPAHHTPQQQTPQYQHTPQYSQVSQPQQQQTLHSQQTITTTTSAITNPTIATTNDTVVPVSNQENVSGSTSVVSSLDPNLIHQIQQILMKSEEGTPVVNAVAALSLQAPHAMPSVSQSLPQIPPPVSLPPPQTSTSVSLSIPSLQDNKPGILPRVPPSDYDGRSFAFLPVDTSQPPPGYHPGYQVINKNKVAQPSIPQQPANISHNSTSESIIEILHSEVSNPKSPREEGEHSDDSENKENQDDVIECDRRHRSRSRSLSRSKRNKRRSRSLSNSRSRHRRSRSRSRNRRSRSRERERDRDRRDRERSRRDREKEKINYEKERERKKRGLPPMKKEYLSICSTTLWVGHLSKLVHQEELSDTFGEYGDIVSIDLIPPRGCAFICMNRRQDAARALIKLKNHKMHNKAITLAWAPGKGVKGKEFKDFWEVDVGCSYIPFSKLSQMSNLDLDSFEDGGMIDEETVPSFLKGRYGSGESSNLTVSQNTPHGHLPPSMVNMGIPPPISSRQERPPPPPPHQPITTAPPPINKDQREETRTGIPPPLLPPFAMQNMPPPGGIPMGAQIIPTNMPPSLPPPIGVPPPIAIPPLNVPPSSNMLGQPLIRVPPHISPATSVHPPPIGSPSLVNTSANSIATHDSENMDVEMEDVHKQDTLIQRTPPNRESIGVAEFMESVSKRELDFEYESSGGLEAKKRDGEGGDKNSNELDKRKLSNAPNAGNEFRNEGFGTFGPGTLPMHRAPPPPFTSGPMGIIPRNGPNFVGPRPMHSFNTQRGILPAPPPIMGSRPNLLQDLQVGSHGLIAQGIGGPRPVGLRPGRIIGSVQNPRGIGAPNLINRFGAPNFPRFGVISGPRHLSLHPSPLDEEQGEWNNLPPGVGRYMKIHPVDEDVWNPDEDLFSQRNRMEKDIQIVPHQRVEELVRKEDPHMDTLSRNTHPFEGKSNNARIMSDKFLNGGMRHCDEDKERERFRESERDWDRSRERDWDRRSKERNWERGDRERTRGKEWERERGRDRDRNRERDREDRWRGRERERERDRDRDFNRYNDNNSIDRYRDNRSREKSFERSSRWNCDNREEKREDRRLRNEDMSRSNDASEETMTWDNWASFSNFGVVPTLHKKTEEVSSVSSMHEQNKNDNYEKKSDIQNISSASKDPIIENKSFDTENKPVSDDGNRDKSTNKDGNVSDKISSDIICFELGSSSNNNSEENCESRPSEDSKSEPNMNLESGKSLKINLDECVPKSPKFVDVHDSLKLADTKEVTDESSDDFHEAFGEGDAIHLEKKVSSEAASPVLNQELPDNMDENFKNDSLTDKPTENEMEISEFGMVNDNLLDKTSEHEMKDDNLPVKTSEYEMVDDNLLEKTSKYEIVDDSVPDKTLEYEKMVDDNLPGKASEIEMVDNNLPGKASEIEMVDNNLPGKASEIEMVDNNLPGRASENEMVDNNLFEKTSKFELVDDIVTDKTLEYEQMAVDNLPDKTSEYEMVDDNLPGKTLEFEKIIDDNNLSDKTTKHEMVEDNFLDKISKYEMNTEENVESELSDDKENFNEVSVEQNQYLEDCLENASNKELSQEQQISTENEISETCRQEIPSVDIVDDAKQIWNECSINADDDTNNNDQWNKEEENTDGENLINPTESELLTNPVVESSPGMTLIQNDESSPGMALIQSESSSLSSSSTEQFSSQESFTEQNDNNDHIHQEKEENELVKETILEDNDN